MDLHALTLPALRTATAALPPPQKRALWRAWLRPRSAHWLALVRPQVYSAGFPDGPKRALVEALSGTPAAAPDRPPVSILAEMGRGLGKTNIARGVALHRGLEGAEHGIVFGGAREADATAAVKDLLALQIPPLRARERASDPEVAQWLSTPMGWLYPSLRYSGSVTELQLHLDGRVIPVWTITRGGSTRGRVYAGIRPSLCILDDLVTLEAAQSEQQAAQIVEWVEDDVRGLGGTSAPAALWWLGNAIAAGDSLDLAARSGRWQVLRGAVWAPHAPPSSPEKAALLAELLAIPSRDPVPAELREQWRDRLPALLAGARPTDPDVDPVALLRQEALTGERAFARAFMCVRLAPGAALWPMDAAHLVDLRPELMRGSRGAVWLDPRGSEAGDHGDFAAAAAVARLADGSRVVVEVAAERCRKAGQRALYWRCVDALIKVGVTSISGGYETNNGANLALGDDWAPDAVERRRRGLLAPIPEGQSSGAGKYSTERLDRVTDHIADGRLKWSRHLLDTPSWRRMSRIPHDHDDDADAVERADHLVSDVPDLAGWAAMVRTLR